MSQSTAIGTLRGLSGEVGPDSDMISLSGTWRVVMSLLRLSGTWKQHGKNWLSNRSFRLHLVLSVVWISMSVSSLRFQKMKRMLQNRQITWVTDSMYMVTAIVVIRACKERCDYYSDLGSGMSMSQLVEF